MKNKVKFAFNVAKKIIGSKASSSQIPMMGSEDFSYFLKKFQAVLLGLEMELQHLYIILNMILMTQF